MVRGEAVGMWQVGAGNEDLGFQWRLGWNWGWAGVTMWWVEGEMGG